MSGEHNINRRAILWNVQQPGDAYDIRKSMIAKLPEHPARFMGDNLQLVCLFQAAEIQRLAQFLDEMTLEMRAIQRIQLDRHSYQVQIKQLAERLQLTNQYKSENAKLREFIKGQSQELQNLQKYRNTSQNLTELQTKYESVLNELRISRQNYSALQRTNNQSLREIAEWRFKFQKVQKSLIEERQIRQREIKIIKQKTTLEIRSIFESKQYQLKGEINVMKQNLMLKNRQIQLQKSKNQQLSKLLAEKQELLGKYARGEIQGQANKTQQFLRISRRLQESTYYLQQKEKNILNLKDEITYLNKKLKSHQQQLKRKQDELRKKQQQIRKRDQDIRRKDFQIQAKQSTFNNNQQLFMRISEKEQKISILSSEIERLSQSLNMKDKQIVDQERQLTFYKEKSVSFQKTVDFLQKEIKEKQNAIKRIQHDSHIFQDKDNKITALGGEIQRLNIVMREKLNEMSRIENRFNDLTQSYNQQFNLLRARQEAIRMLEDKCRDYDMKIGSLQESNKLNFDEINRLNLKLAGVQNQNIQLRRQIDSKIQISSEIIQLRNQLSVINEEVNRKNIENKKLREDNETMFKEINEMEAKIRKSQNSINEFQMNMDKIVIEKDSQIREMQITFSQNEQSYLEKIDMYLKSMPKMSSQIERLHQMMEKRNMEMKKLQQELDIQREKNRLIERRNSTQNQMRILEYERTISFYESKCKNLEKINSDMSGEKNLIVEKVQSLELKLRESQFELDKLITALKVKEVMYEEHEKNSTILQSAVNQLREENLTLQKESLKNRQELQLNFEMVRRLQYEVDLSRRDLFKCQGNCSALNEQNARLKQIMEQSQYKNPELVQTIESLRHQLAKYENEKQHLMQEINDKKIKIQAYESDLRTFQMKISQHQESLRHTEQANSIKLQELRQRMMQDFDIRIKNESAKYNKLQQMYRQLQVNFNTNVDHFKSSNQEVESLHDKNNELMQHLNECQQKLFSYEERFALLSQEIQRLTIQNRQWKKMNEKRVNEQANGDGEKMRLLNDQLQKTRIEVGNLRLMLQQLESINEHAIAQRDELFAITHQQEDIIQKQKYEIDQLTNEVMQMRGNQSSESSELKRLRDQYNMISNQHSILKQQYTELSSQVQLSNKRLAQFNTATIREQQINAQQTQLRLHNLTQQYEQILNQQRQRNLQHERNIETKSRTLSILEKENIQIKEKLNELEVKLSSQEEMLSQVQQLKTAYINIKMENEELNRMLQEMQQQLFETKQEAGRLAEEKKLHREENYSRLISQNTQLKTMLQQQRQTLLAMKQKVNSVSIQIQQLQHSKTQTDERCKALEDNLLMVQNENSYLRRQAENLRMELTQTSVYQEISTDLETKYNGLYTAYEETYNIYNLLKVEHQTTKERLHVTEIKIQQLNQEFDNLNMIISQLKNRILILTQENQQLRANFDQNSDQFHKLTLSNQDLQKELQRIYQLNLDLTNQVTEIRLRLSDQHTLEENIKHNMILFVMMCAEIESLRKRVLQSQQECQQVRRSSISPLKTKK